MGREKLVREDRFEAGCWNAIDGACCGEIPVGTASVARDERFEAGWE